MKQLFRYALLLVAAAIFFTSCSNKKNEQGKLIPKNAIAVIAVDPQSLLKKIETGKIPFDSIIKKVFNNSNSDSETIQLLTTLKESGIDLKEKVYLFATAEKKITSSSINGSFNIIATIKDISTFENYIQKQKGFAGIGIKKDSNYSYLQADSTISISWTKDYAMITIYHSSTFPSSPFSLSTPSFQATPATNPTDDLQKLVQSFHSLKETESINTLSYFNQMANDKSDCSVLFSSNYYPVMMSGLPLQLSGMESLFKDNYYAIQVNFDDGKITGKSSFYPNHVFDSLLKKYPTKNIDLSAFNNYPSKSIDGIYAISFPFALVGDIIRYAQMEGLLSIGLAKTGLTTDDIYNCLSGDMTFICSDFTLPQKTNPFERNLPKAKFIFNAGIGNKESFDKVVNLLVQMGIVAKQNDTYVAGETVKQLGYYIHINDKRIVVSNDAETGEQYALKIQPGSIDNNLINSFKDYSSGMYIDLEKILSGIPAEGDDKALITSLQNTFKTITVKSKGYDDKSSTGEMEITFKDEKQNSLVSLLNAVVAIADQVKKQQEVIYEDDGGKPMP